MNALYIFELAFLSIVLVHFKTTSNSKKHKFIYIKNVRLGNLRMNIKCNLYNGLIVLNARIKFDYRFKISSRLKLSQSFQNRFESTYIL